MNGIIIASAVADGVALSRFPGWAPWAIIIGTPVVLALIVLLVGAAVVDEKNEKAVGGCASVVIAMLFVGFVAGILAANLSGSHVATSNLKNVESHYGISNVKPVVAATMYETAGVDGLRTNSDDTNTDITFVGAHGIESKGRFVVSNRVAHIYVGTGSSTKEYGETRTVSDAGGSDGGRSAYDYGSANGSAENPAHK